MLEMNPVASALLDLIRRASTELPQDVECALRAALDAERPAGAEGRDLGNSPARAALATILENSGIARSGATPVCQDTGTPSFWFDIQDGTETLPLREAVREAVAAATAAGLLRLNVIEVPSGRQVSSNFAEGSPSIHFRFGPRGTEPRATVLLKGGGSENQGRQYSLPDSSLGAGRDLEGVRKCLLDAVWRSQGAGCAPGILGVCVGGDRAGAWATAKEQLLRPLGDESHDPQIASLEKQVLDEANSLGIGPMGLGGRTTLLGVKIATLPRVPASFFVTVAYNCWACRRASCRLPLA